MTILKIFLAIASVSALSPSVFAAEAVGPQAQRASASLAVGGFDQLNPEMREITDKIFEPRLAYATDDNFMQQAVYPSGFDKIFLHQDCKAMLAKAGEALKRLNITSGSTWRFVVYDALRPCVIQQKMFKIKPDPRYVADPGNCEDPIKVGQHNLGMAIDIGLAGADGRELEMGTPFDAFDEISHIDHEERLPEIARKNRKILRDVMTAGGMKTIRTEWWHFNCPKQPGKTYSIQK